MLRNGWFTTQHPEASFTLHEDPVLSRIVTGVFGNMKGFLLMPNDTASNLGSSCLGSAHL